MAYFGELSHNLKSPSQDLNLEPEYEAGVLNTIL
jgi:hypothetical protein